MPLLIGGHTIPGPQRLIGTPICIILPLISISCLIKSNQSFPLTANLIGIPISRFILFPQGNVIGGELYFSFGSGFIQGESEVVLLVRNKSVGAGISEYIGSNRHLYPCRGLFQGLGNNDCFINIPVF